MNILGYQIFEELRYIIEILVAQYMLTIPTPLKRRDNFTLKIITSSVLLITISQLYFAIATGISILNSNYPLNLLYFKNWNDLAKLWYLFLLILSIINLKILFDAPLSTILFRTSAAWSIQHIEYVIANELIGLGVLADKREEYLILYIFISIFSCALIYFVCYKIFKKFLKIENIDNFKNKSTSFFYSFFILVLVNFTFFCQGLFYNTYSDGWFYEAAIYDILICLVFICGQYFMLKFYQSNLEKSQKERLYQERKKQFEQSQNTIDFINKQVHDLKHQLNGIKKLSIEASQPLINETTEKIKLYDSFYHTKNEVLDVLLTEKHLIANKENIKMNVIVDSSNLSFINDIDLYILLGNILDNAIEAIKKLKDDDKKIISLVIKKRDNFLCIAEENYFDGKLNMQNGIIKTSKENQQYHGYGLKSIKDIASKYNGIAKISPLDEIFSIQILIPMPIKN